MVLSEAASSDPDYLRKSHMQLASEMRFVSAQLLALFDGDLYLRNGAQCQCQRHRRRLRERVEAGIADGSMPGVVFTQETHVNAVFAVLPDGVAARPGSSSGSTTGAPPGARSAECAASTRPSRTSMHCSPR